MNEKSVSDEAGHYEIGVGGHLDARWAAWFDGFGIATGIDGTTLIHGPVADQAALHGMLGKVRDVGLPLISVLRLPPVALQIAAEPKHRSIRTPTVPHSRREK